MLAKFKCSKKMLSILETLADFGNSFKEYYSDDFIDCCDKYSLRVLSTHKTIGNYEFTIIEIIEDYSEEYILYCDNGIIESNLSKLKLTKIINNAFRNLMKKKGIKKC